MSPAHISPSHEGSLESLLGAPHFDILPDGAHDRGQEKRGASWPIKRLAYAGSGAYSSLTAGRPGTASEGWIYLQFEGGPNHMCQVPQFARFNFAWLLAGESTGDGDVPAWIRSES